MTTFYVIPSGTPQRRCMSCNAPVFWLKTKRGARMIVNQSGEPHWATCPHAKNWKGKKRSDPDHPQPELEL